MHQTIMSPNNASFLIISDTHGLDIHENTAQPFRLPLPKVDVLHCGDLTQVGGHGPFRKALKMLGEIDAELKLVIAGNHDLELDGDYWRSHLNEEDGDEPEEHDQAVAIMKGPLAKEAGVTYLEQGTHTFTLKSGVSFSIYVSPYSPAINDYAFGYPGNVGCDHLLAALNRAKPLLHCFGHIHEGHGARTISWDEKADAENYLMVAKPVDIDKTERWHTVRKSEKSNETLAVNAVIQGENGEFCNAPWLVYLPL
ncbi:Metallo-dependent phosphatase [Aureobasidium pullulans]|uniref:Metallo-dependent phosphatase n=2 Tax=Aureobasidium pullulans TaxID=5580 RepID=A0A4S9B793_AURPU|nr:Metallo-dependent phosphatase [Aureobasidium pullulans]